MYCKSPKFLITQNIAVITLNDWPRAVTENSYRKIPKFSDARKICCNLQKIKRRGQTLGYFVKKMEMELQTVKTLIRLLLEEQSDLGLHCLPTPICPKKLRIITEIQEICSLSIKKTIPYGGGLYY